jgi:hypothetical protein
MPADWTTTNRYLVVVDGDDHGTILWDPSFTLFQTWVQSNYQ